MSKLVLRNLTCRFGSVTAVDDIDLALTAGEFVSLLGPSGCGKTTTLRMIAGFLSPSAGTIEMDGQVIASPASSLPPEKRGMSMIFQSYAIWPNMTVAQNVAFGLEVRRLTRTEIRQNPQSLHLHRQAPPASDATCLIPGRVVQRAYLGEHWDYAIHPTGTALTLRVTARPHEVFEVSERVWLEVDPRQMAHTV